MGLIVDLYGGPGGWDVAASELGLDPIGIEYETWACRTRAAAGFATIQADVSTIDPARFAGLDGLIASPPCQGFSSAGKGAARDLIPELLASIRARRWGDRVDPDPRVWLIVDLGRWLEQLDPGWIALEQVPAVLPIWRAYADMLRDRGYSVWTGLLNAADFGVPQTRTRAILMAARGRVVHPPEPTHARAPQASLFGTQERWVTMAEALGWGMTARPGLTLMFGTQAGGADPMGVGGSGARRSLHTEIDGGRWIEGQLEVGFPRRDDVGTSPDGYRERDWTGDDEPAPTLTGRGLTGMVIRARGINSERSCDRFDGTALPSRVVTSRTYSWLVSDEPGSCSTCGGAREVLVGDPHHTDDCDCAWDETPCAQTVAPCPDCTEAVKVGDDWVVATGMNSMSVSRDPEDMQPYERPIDQPAPTLGTMSGGQWTVGPPGHRRPPHRWKVEYRRGGDRIHEGVDPEAEPAQTLTSRADRWQVHTNRGQEPGTTDRQTFDPAEVPAKTVTGKSGGQWHIRGGGALENATVRSEDEPAPTLMFGHDSAGWVFERPSTTVMGDPRAFQPGGHHTPGAQSENSIRLSIEDALILQSFDPDFPVQGTKTRQFEQVGNAICPLLAWHILRALTT